MDLVKMNNDLINLPLRKFNASEIDILHTICFEMKNKGLEEITLGFDEIRKLSHFQNKNNEQFLSAIHAMNEKLIALHFTITDGSTFTQFVLFPTFVTDPEAQTLRVRVNRDFKYLLNDFMRDYTSFELEQSAQLKSTYAKQIYKKLHQFKSTGLWITSLEEFREFLVIPASYGTGQIEQSIIKPALEELEPLFENLNLVHHYAPKKKGQRGRRAITGYEFRFTPFTIEGVNKSADQQERVGSVTGWDKTSRYCPKCKRAMYRKLMTNEDGDYYLYGHPDFKTGECDYTTFDYADLLDNYQLTDEEPLTNEQMENKKRLSKFFGSLFGSGE